MDASNPWLAVDTDDLPPLPAKYPQLQRLDRSVVCQICKELFKGPVSIACGHSFCSQCIRSSLDVQKKCPSCNEPASEGQIRRNRALEEITDAWEEARPILVELTKPTVPRKRIARAEVGESSTKPSSSNGIKRPRRSSGSGSPAGQQRGPSGNGIVSVPDSDEVGEGEDEEEGVDEIDGGEMLDENDEAPCPLCSARLPIASIPLHIERGCPPPRKKPSIAGSSGSGNQKADWRKVFSGAGGGGPKVKEAEMKRITKPNYSLTSPAELRSILQEYNLPTHGDRPTLEARLQEYIILHNSNLDTSHPRSLASLRAKLAEWEQSKKRDKERGKDALGKMLASEEGMKEYVKARGGEFERLRKSIIERDKARAAGAGAGAAAKQTSSKKSGQASPMASSDGRADTPIEIE